MILDEILKHKKTELRVLKKTKSLLQLRQEVQRLPQTKNFFFISLKKARQMAVIAEIKRRSPSKGTLCKNFNPVKIALDYERAGASALSVLTDQKYFGGSLEILKKVKKNCALPILRKDFIIDEYQIYETRLIEADAILLIARVLDAKTLKRFHSLAKELGLEVLFEVHDAADLKKVWPLKPQLVGINNRDLSNFRVDLSITQRLASKVPKHCLLVSESGISSAKDLIQLKKYGVKVVLVGETLMKNKKPGEALKQLLNNTEFSSSDG